MEGYGRRDLTHVLPKHVNEEAVIFRGCTTTEITIITAVAAIFWLSVTAIIGSLLDLFYVILGTSLLLVLITVFVISSLFQVVKRGRAPGHYQQLVSIAMSRVGLKKSPFVLLDGELPVGRTKQFVLANRHLKVPEFDDF